jgi:hypothetical protein
LYVTQLNIDTESAPQASSYSSDYSNRLFGRNIFRVAAVYSAGLELLSTQNPKIARPPQGQFFPKQNSDRARKNTVIKIAVRE